MDRRALFCALLAVPLAGCSLHGSRATATTTTTAPPTTTAPAPTSTVTVFRVVDGTLHADSVSVPQTGAPASAALRVLGLAAPVTISGGTATVDLPLATRDEQAEIVYTLTVFPTVQRVDLAGRTGLTRADFASYEPVIFVESPAAGEQVPPTFHVTGSASVYEATLVVELVAGGEVVQRNTVTASEGAPARGTFDTVLTAKMPGPAKVVGFAPSAEDGSPQHLVAVPVTVSG